MKLIVEKEREIAEFKPVESWKLSVELSYQKAKFKATLHKINDSVKKLHTLQDVEKVLATLFDDLEYKTSKNKKGYELVSKVADLPFILNDVVKKDSKRKPGAPFTTSTLQQEGARKFGF